MNKLDSKITGYLAELPKILPSYNIEFNVAKSDVNATMLKFIEKFYMQKGTLKAFVNINTICQSIQRMLEICYEHVYTGGELLWFTLDDNLKDKVKDYATLCNSSYINNKCNGGFFTNFNNQTIKIINVYHKLHQYFKTVDTASKVNRSVRKNWKQLHTYYLSLKKIYEGINLAKKPGVVVFFGNAYSFNFLKETSQSNIKSIIITPLSFNCKYADIIVPTAYKIEFYEFIAKLLSDTIIIAKRNLDLESNTNLVTQLIKNE